MLLEIVLATLFISILSFVGILVTQRQIKRFMHFFVTFAAGTLVAVSFFGLLPNALEELEGLRLEESLVFVVLGIVLFFLIERLIHWHHCDKDDCDERPAGLLILTGDFFHNFLDGVLIAGAFILDTATGIVTTISVAIHEIPQEFGDFAVLIHSGYKKNKALLLNFYSALSAVLGGVLGYFVFDAIGSVAPYAVLVTAGGFLYVALSDIMPSLHRHRKDKSVIFLEAVIFMATLVGMYFLLMATHGRA